MNAPQPDPIRIALESKIADLERLVETLNEVLVAHDLKLDGMDARLQRLEHLRPAATEPDTEASPQDPADERPPHY